jgi:hypothetical protein
MRLFGSTDACFVHISGVSTKRKTGKYENVTVISLAHRKISLILLYLAARPKQRMNLPLAEIFSAMGQGTVLTLLCTAITWDNPLLKSGFQRLHHFGAKTGSLEHQTELGPGSTEASRPYRHQCQKLILCRYRSAFVPSKPPPVYWLSC